MPAGYMGKQRTMRGGRRRRNGLRAKPFGSRKVAGEQAYRSRLNITFAAGDLSGKAQPRLCAQAQRTVQQLRRIDESVAMQTAEPGELGLHKTRNHAEDPHLLGVLQLGLEANDV